ncbi:hypothetical protein [Sphingobium xenophagum]|uniref:hypothetical protein n=1 Tax=Sphingobium xenophagum TaxID=121428 RepID=UPI001030FFBB|nr:hypothetical protein [Sphingobium xenophagum]
MRAYDVSTTCGTMSVTIFARTNLAASQMFDDLFFDRYGDWPKSFTTCRRSVKRDDNPTALSEALALGKSGLGTYSNGAWTITPLA